MQNPSPGLPSAHHERSYRLNVCMGIVHCPLGSARLINFTLGDVGGQKTLRTYWRNYFEKTDALIWVVDATDQLRITDCRQELRSLLLEEVRFFVAQSTEAN